jgi:hypothetical protein
MKKWYSLASIAALALAFTVPALSVAGEISTGELKLYKSRIKTVGAPGEVIGVPACPGEVQVFSTTPIRCPSGGCTIEADVSSELSDVSGSYDSVRFHLYIDGSPVGVNPNYNVGVQSTAHSKQIETATMSWMKNRLPSGWHSVDVKFCVADSDGGGAFAFAGDRALTVRSYKGN